MPLLQDIKHLAILMPSWVGDIVMASYVWKMARSKFPNAKITAIIRPHLAPLLERVEEIDDVLELEMKSSVFAARKKLKAINADAVVLLPNSIRSAIIAKLSGIPIRCGYKRDWRSWLLTDGVEVEKSLTPTPTSAYYLHLANTLFGMNEQNALPSMKTGDVKPEILHEMSTPLVLLVAGASKEQKRWAPKNFANVADALTEMGATCIGIGSPEEYDVVQEIVQVADSHVHNFTRSGITLGSLATLIAHADLMITNDTGPRHLAVACGTPTITLYGPTDYRWTRYQCAIDIPLLADPFLPDTLVADSNPERCDINNIPPSDVIAVATRFLK